MSEKNPYIDTRLRLHPSIVQRRSPAILWAGVGGFAVLIVCWVLLLVNAAELSQQFAEHQDTAVTLNQRVGSRFGVPIGAIALPVIALLPLLLGWFFSKRYYLRSTGSRLRRRYRGNFPSTAQQGEDFQRMLRTRDAAAIGEMNAGTERGNLVVEGWASEEDRVAFVGVYAFDLKHDPHWELVEFSGDDYPSYEAVFGERKA